MVTGIALNIKRFAGIVLHEKLPPKYIKSGRTKICVERVEMRFSRNFQKFGNHEKYFSILGDTKISPAVAKNESWKEASKRMIFGFTNAIKKAAKMSAESA